jgi:hypothetical protein
MKKFTLLFSLFIFLMGTTFAQTVKMCSLKQGDHQVANKLDNKAPVKGEVIWSEDFNGTKWSATVVEDEYNGYDYSGTPVLPEGWSVADPHSYFWHWSDVGPRGCYTGTPTARDTRDDYIDDLGGSAENGFFMLESDWENTVKETGEMVAEDNVTDMDSYVLFGPINFSGQPYVQFNIREVFRYCCNNSDTKLILSLSTNYNPNDVTSGQWQDYNLKNGVVGNEYSAQALSINVSRQIGNKSSVYFRIKNTGGSHYFWMIDDISFSVPVANELIVEDVWYDYLYAGRGATENTDASFTFSGGYSNIPEQLAGEFVAFRASISDFGSANQTAGINVTVNKDNVKVYDHSSPTIELVSGQVDTAKLETKYSFTEKGFYQISGTLVLETPDTDPSNNNFSYDFNVTDNFYSRNYYRQMSSYAGPQDWQKCGNDDAIAQQYDFPENKGTAKIAGIRFYMPTYIGWTDELTSIGQGNYTAIAHAWTDADVPQIFASSEPRVISISDLGTWIYLPFNEDGELYIPDTDGGYSILVGMELSNNYVSKTNEVHWSIGADNENIKQPLDGGYVYSKGQSKWFVTGDNYMIDLYLDDMPKNITFNVDMADAIEAGTFDADNDYLYVTGSFVNWAEPASKPSIRMTDANGDGVYTAIVDAAANTTYQYKYFINSGAGAEWDGNENREAKVVTGNITKNDIFGVKPGTDVVETPANLKAISIYPNPFNNEMVIENAKDVKSITVSNIVGQTLIIKTNITEKYTLSTSELQSGVYFITFTDNNNNKLTVRRIKQ